MKKILLYFVLVIGIASLSAASTYRMKQYPFYAGLNLHLFRVSGNNSQGSIAKLNYGGCLGYNYTPSFALELSGNSGKSKPSDPEASGFTAWTTASDIRSETEFYNLDFAFRYNFLPDRFSNPYLSFGVGKLYWKVSNDDAIITDTYDYTITRNNNYAFASAGLENKINEHFSIILNFKRLFIFGDTFNLLADGESPDAFTQLGLEFVGKFGRGVIEVVDLVGIEAVTFEFNSTKITSESYKIIDHVVMAMKKNPDLVIEVRGFTDNTGSDSVNLRVSKKRALSVKQLLVDRGISPSRIITTGLGHQNPIATNSTAEGRALNRRVEFYELDK
jgi:hypothetical protein